MRTLSSKAAATSFIAVLVGFPAFGEGEAAWSSGATPSRFLFYDGKAQGWYWKNEPEEPEQTPPQETPAEPAPPPPDETKPAESAAGPAPFSVQWLRENVPRLQDRALDHPTPANVTAWLYAQRVALDKAQKFQEVASRAVANDPLLDEGNRSPLASFARFPLEAARGQTTDAAVRRLAGLGGLWMFYDSSCVHCEPMADAVQGVAARYEFETLFISVDNKPLRNVQSWVADAGQAERLKLTMTPTTLFVVPPDGFFVISQGAMAQPQLVDRLLLAAEHNGMLSRDEIDAIYPERRGLLRPEDLRDGAEHDPQIWVQLLR